MLSAFKIDITSSENNQKSNVISPLLDLPCPRVSIAITL